MFAEGFDRAQLEAIYKDRYQDFDMFAEEVLTRTSKDGSIVGKSPSVIYTSKKRIKAIDSLGDKIEKSDRMIDANSLLTSISDIGGVRVVVLHRAQIFQIDGIVKKNLDLRRWALREVPKAYEIDHVAQEEFRARGFEVNEKKSYYTSVHYLISPASDADICCELQVRTLLEEIWGEVEHFLRYKSEKEAAIVAGDSEALAEAKRRMDHQMRTFAHIIQSGRSFLDMVFEEFQQAKKAQSAPKSPEKKVEE